MKTSELIGPALDWAVAKCEFKDEPKISPNGYVTVGHDPRFAFCPSTEWGQGGPIIEREKISPAYEPSMVYDDSCRWKAMSSMSAAEHQYGPTPLIAAMRFYVASKMGDEIEIPEELQKP